MDFTLGKEHEMARTLFHDFAEKEVKIHEYAPSDSYSDCACLWWWILRI